MALSPTHKPAKFVANKVFTDRENATELFERQLRSSQRRDEYRILNWYGVGGQGKSALSRECLRMFGRIRENAPNRPSRIRYSGARIEFESPPLRQPEQALLALRLQLGETGKIEFPAFDFAFARYFCQCNPGIDMRQRHPELFRGESEILTDLADALEGGVAEFATDLVKGFVPGLSVLVKYGSRLQRRSREWWERRGKRELVGLDNMTSDQILEKLPTYFGMDICDAMERDSKLKALIILDGYEALWRDSNLSNIGTLGHRVDGWVRRLVQDSPGTLFAIFGRDRLTWSDVDKEWGEVIDDHLLEALSEEDADRFLQEIPITETDIRRAIITGAEGLPFYLDLQVDLYTDMKANDEALTAQVFGGSHPDILARFLDHLSDRHENILRIASYPAFLTEEGMMNLADKFAGGSAGFNWANMTNRSFVRQDQPRYYTLHRLMKDALQAKEKLERPVLFAAIHRHLFERLSERIPKRVSRIQHSHGVYFLECLAHLSHIGGDRDWEAATLAKFEAAAQSRTLQTYWQLNYDLCLRNLGPKHEHTLTVRHHLAYQLGPLGDHRGARDEFKDIYNIQKETLGAEHMNSLTTRSNLAHELSSLGEHKLARNEFQAIYDIWKRPDLLGQRHPNTLACRHNLARQLGFLGKHRAARDEFQAVYDARVELEELGSNHINTLNTRHELANQHGRLGDHAAARAEFQAIYDIQSRTDMLGPEHPDTLSARAALAYELGNLGEHEDSLDEFRAIYDIQIGPNSYGPEHPGTLGIRYYLAQQLGKLGRYAEAKREFEQVYDLRKRPDILGEDHPDTLVTRSQIACMNLVVGCPKQSVAVLEDIFAALACPEMFGPDHPRLLRLKFHILQAKHACEAQESSEKDLKELRRKMTARFAKTHFWIRELDAFRKRLKESSAA